MLKKKNIAMMTAVVSVATAVTPAFAAVQNTTVTQNDVEKVISEVETLLNTRYTSSKVTGQPAQSGNGTTTSGSTVEAHLNSVYEISATVDNKTTTITNTVELRTMLENANVQEKTVTLTIVDKGHEKVDGQIVGEKEFKVGSRYIANDFANLVSNNPNATVITGVTSNAAASSDFDEDGLKRGSKAVITLINGTEIELFANESAKLDFTKPVDANGNVVDLNGATQEIKKSVVGFKEAAQVSSDEMYDIVAEKKAEVKIVAGKIATEEFNASDLYADGGLTGKGSKFFAFLNKDTSKGAETVASKSNTFKVSVDGTYYAVTYDRLLTGNDVSKIVKDGNGYKFSVNVVVADPTNIENTKKDVTLVIKGEDQSELVRLRNAVSNSDDVTKRNAALKKDVTLIAGDDRFKTAVSISKTSYATNTNAKAVVLVGEEAIVDGLAVAPLASAADAPVLLTGKDELNASTKAEITRLLDQNANLKTIYVVGGTSVISSDVENELREFGITIKRLAGEDRTSTSIAIGKELLKVPGLPQTAKSNAYVVGADGEADAMSIASKAAEEKAPIIVTAANGLSDAAKAFIKDASNVEVIGGESKVSTQVIKDIKDNSNDGTITRISGKDRHETNANVIKAHYNKNKTTNIYVAKDAYGVGQDSKLIDALAVAPLAGNTAMNNGVGAPIVLATSDITTDQVKAIEAVKTTSGTHNLFQVGRGIASQVINTISSKLTFTSNK